MSGGRASIAGVERGTSVGPRSAATPERTLGLSRAVPAAGRGRRAPRRRRERTRVGSVGGVSPDGARLVAPLSTRSRCPRELRSGQLMVPPPEPTRIGPVRTCVGCRSKGSPAALLRVVAADGVLTPDPRRRIPGRGAWLHLDQGCLDTAERRRAFGRALRRSGELDGAPLRDYLAAHPAGDAGQQGRAPQPAGPPTAPRKQVDPS